MINKSVDFVPFAKTPKGNKKCNHSPIQSSVIFSICISKIFLFKTSRTSARTFRYLFFNCDCTIFLFKTYGNVSRTSAIFVFVFLRSFFFSKLTRTFPGLPLPNQRGDDRRHQLLRPCNPGTVMVIVIIIIVIIILIINVSS